MSLWWRRVIKAYLHLHGTFLSRNIYEVSVWTKQSIKMKPGRGKKGILRKLFVLRFVSGNFNIRKIILSKKIVSVNYNL